MTTILGYLPCDLCGETAKVKQTRKGHLYATCVATDCGHQLFCRSAGADRRLAGRITKWTNREDRLTWLGTAALPKKAQRPEPEPEDPAEPYDPEDPEPEPEPEDPADPEPEDDPPPRRPVRRAAPPARRSAKPPAGKKPWWDLDL